MPLHAAERDGAHAFPHVLGPPDLLAIDALLLALPQPAAVRVVVVQATAAVAAASDPSPRPRRLRQPRLRVITKHHHVPGVAARAPLVASYGRGK